MANNSQLPGMLYFPNFIDPENQQFIVSKIDQSPWNTDMKRRVQHFGYRYDYKARSVSHHDKLGALPVWAEDIALRLHREGLFATKPDQVIVNEYEPGQGISAHIDCEPCFGPVIASVSLLSACDLVFRHRVSGDVFSLRLEPMSLLVLSDEARYDWTHEIPSRKSDSVDGVKIARSRRISLTFRTVVIDR